MPPAFAAHTFKPGQSGNPGGRTREFAECQRLARKASPEAMQRLIALMSNDDPRISGWAADKVLERAWGKPKEYDPKAEQSPTALAFDPSRLTPQQLEEVKRAMVTLMSATVPQGEER